MPGLELIDSHIHAFPTKEEGLAFLAQIKLQRAPETVGSPDELLAFFGKLGVSRIHFVMLTFTKALYDNALKELSTRLADQKAAEKEARNVAIGKLKENNRWAASVIKTHKAVSYYAGVDAAMMSEKEMLTEAEANIRAGAKGIKISPNQMRVYGDDPCLRPLFNYCQAQEIPLLTVTGGAAGPRGLGWTHPQPFGEALKQFPKLPLIFAHMGHGTDEEVVKLTNAYPNVCGDLSLRLDEVADGKMPQEEMVKLIRKAGVDRVLFGTNLPLGDPAKAAKVFAELPLKDAEREAIASKNFKRVLKEAK